MKNFPVALQLYSVRNEMAADFEGTLRKVKDLGYDGVEFAGLFDHSAADIKKMCEEIGLVPISAHVPYLDMKKDPDLLNVYKEIGCQYVVIPYLTPEYRPGQPGFAQVIDDAKMLGEKANSLGMKLCYHNHDFEFEKIDGEYALDILYKEVSADLLQPELDVCWVNVGGENPVDYIHKYAGRIEILHLKDFSGSKSENMYALIGIDDDKEKADDNKFEFRPIGMGLQNMPAIVSAAGEVNTKWLVVEQDEPSLGKAPMECAKASIDYLNTL